MKCCICEKEAVPGLMVNGHALCRACEREVIKKAVTDEGYDRCVQRLKVLFGRQA